MINLEKAKSEFEKYSRNYDVEDQRIRLKIDHTYRVAKCSKFIAEDLNLSNEDIDLAELIGLLHDIARLEQQKVYNTFEDSTTIDHAKFGCDILFTDNFIRNFVEDDKYDEIIKKAIYNHNKYKIEEGLNERELLHAKIIRDSDKLDNFKVKEIENMEILLRKPLIEVGKEEISDKIYNDFMDCKCVLRSDRKTKMDEWISWLAFIFDFNFNSGLKVIRENDYINKNIDRINYTNPDTKQKMENIRKFALEYIDNKLKNN